MKTVLQKIFIYGLAFCIPALLVVDSLQAKRFAALENEVKEIQEKQYDVIESNKYLIANICVLAAPERIEQLALETLKMRKAMPNEIVRVEIKGKKNGK